MPRRVRSLVLLLSVPLAGGLLAACGSSGSSTSPTTASSAAPATTQASGGAAASWPAACTLVTAADITSVVGTAPKDPPSNSSATECDYSSPSAYNFVNASVHPELSTTFFRQDTATAGATDAVSGVGEAAYETPLGAQAGSILVLKDKHSLRIDLYEPVTAATQAQLRQLALTALGRVG